MNIIPNRLYRHFKGKLYYVHDLVTHTETGEVMVSYQALYPPYGMYTRPLVMFGEEVSTERPDNPLKQRYRFQEYDGTLGTKQATIDQLFSAMVEFDRGSAERIQHFTKVHTFARQIALGEGLAPETQYTLELAALTHDIGIRPATERHGYCNGKLQEEIGPTYAREMLEELAVEESVVERICYLIAHHHTYTNVDGLDYRILLEADFLVNLYENQVELSAIQNAYDAIFVTNTGRNLCRTMFDL